MHNETTTTSHDEGYETSDLNVGLVWAFLGALALILFGGVIATIIILRGFDASRGPNPLNTLELSPLAVEENRQIDGPPLQMNVKKDRDAVLQSAEEHLENYGIVSDEPGMERAHVPIERAFKLLLEDKVTYRQQPAQAAETADGAPAAQEDS
jgi:hypothetical protein